MNSNKNIMKSIRAYVNSQEKYETTDVTHSESIIGYQK